MEKRMEHVQVDSEGKAAGNPDQVLAARQSGNMIGDGF
jgi:hypothetical protein